MHRTIFVSNFLIFIFYIKRQGISYIILIEKATVVTSIYIYICIMYNDTKIADAKKNELPS